MRNQQDKPLDIVMFQLYKNHLDKTMGAFPAPVGFGED